MSDVTAPIHLALEEMERDECLSLLKTQQIGRLAVADHGYYPPHIVPVNFTLDGESVVFRSNPGLKFKLAILAEHSVSFEVDVIDREGRMAWSVVVQGRAELLRDEEIGAVDLGTWLEPWAEGDRDQWVRIVPYTVTGRRIRPVPVAPASTIG
jgi:nitroimidazol reductase NimA-like FMN-containing flavoprotein (pyridoxamine 5'-phosphate oxidase superfamily)